MKHNEIIITKHGYERSKERQHYNKRQTEKAVANAVSKGKCADNFHSRERDYLSNMSRNGHKAYVYNGFCYIISEDNVCVTTYRLPVWFGKKSHYVGKTKIKNPKKYFLKYEQFCY